MPNDDYDHSYGDREEPESFEEQEERHAREDAESDRRADRDSRLDAAEDGAVEMVDAIASCMDADQLQAAVERWIAESEPEQLAAVRERIDLAIAMKHDERKRAAATSDEIVRRLGIKTDDKPTMFDSRGRPLKRGPIKRRPRVEQNPEPESEL